MNYLLPSFTVATAILPGPHRKRLPALYQYRMTYRNPQPTNLGCVAIWWVTGGRDCYQVACERTKSKHLKWHCTCPDAVYRGTNRHAYCCKHVQGIRAILEAAVPS